jgi:small subunit ribosomal protein S16
VIEELGTYDPMVPETDARAILNGERIKHWISVGAQPTPKVAVLIKKYGADGTHLDAQSSAIDKLGGRRARAIEQARSAAASVPKPKLEVPATPPADEASAEAQVQSTDETAEQAAEDQPAEESAE